jgi:hypothetical protein
MKRFTEYNEQIAMSVGGGAIAGMPTASPAEQTPVPPGATTGKKMLRRKPHDYFGGKPVFKVRSEDYHKAVHGKKYRKHYKSYIGGELGEEVREFAVQNPNVPIIVQDEITGAMFYLKHGKNK